MTSPTERARYASELDGYVEELASGHVQCVLPGLADDSSLRDVARYVENAVGERARMLDEDTRLVALAFEDFGGLIVEYLQTVPRPKYRYGHREASDFLTWLAGKQLDPRQADFIAFQQAEFACLELAHHRQSALRQFRAIQADPASLLTSVTDRLETKLVANPVFIWTQMSGRSFGRDDVERCRVLFAPCGEEILHHSLSEREQNALRALESGDATTIGQWLAINQLSSDTARALLLDWLKKELVALG
jgi:hypothetical protein